MKPTTIFVQLPRSCQGMHNSFVPAIAASGTAGLERIGRDRTPKQPQYYDHKQRKHDASDGGVFRCARTSDLSSGI